MSNPGLPLQPTLQLKSLNLSFNFIGNAGVDIILTFLIQT